MVGLAVALTVGFVLGILLMILLVAGREEEALVDRLEKAESSRTVAPCEPEASTPQQARDECTRSAAPRDE